MSSEQYTAHAGKITAAEENKVRCKCPQDHELSEYCTDSSDWACDECKEQQQAGAFMLGCRLCNWDTCLICAAATQAPSSLPAAIRPEAGSVNKVSLTREILRLKRSHAAGWLTEEEYNFELKKLLSSRSESVETNTLAKNRATEDSSGKTKMFGCPYLHPMKVILLFSLPRFALQGLYACTPSCGHLRCRDDFHVNYVALVTRLGSFDVARTRCRYFWHRTTSGGAIGATRVSRPAHS